MRILILYPFLVHEKATHGSALMIAQYVRRLSRNHEVSLVCLMEDGEEQYLPFTETVGSYCKNFLVFPKPSATLTRRAARYLLASKPNYPMDIFSAEIARQIENTIRQEQIEVFHSIFTIMGEYVGAINVPCAKKVLTADQPYFRDYLRSLRAGGRWTLWAIPRILKWLKMRNYERSLCRKVDTVIAISREEKTALEELVPGLTAAVIPTGVDSETFVLSESEASEPTITFLGNFLHPPNVDSVMWFCKAIFPLILKQKPDARLLVIGADPPAKVHSLGSSPNITVAGTVDDVRPWLEQGWVFICPMRIGGGARGKVLEAMAMGKPVVATPVGLEGILGVPGKDFLVAQTPEEFAHEVLKLLGDGLLRKTIAASARAMVEREHDWDRVIEKLEAVYAEVVRTDSQSVGAANSGD